MVRRTKGKKNQNETYKSRSVYDLHHGSFWSTEDENINKMIFVAFESDETIGLPKFNVHRKQPVTLLL